MGALTEKRVLKPLGGGVGKNGASHAVYDQGSKLPSTLFPPIDITRTTGPLPHYYRTTCPSLPSSRQDPNIGGAQSANQPNARRAHFVWFLVRASRGDRKKNFGHQGAHFFEFCFRKAGRHYRLEIVPPKSPTHPVLQWLSTAI